jgi:hypothetical protein
MDVGPLFIANAQAAKLIKPREGFAPLPTAILLAHCHVQCFAWRARTRCGGYVALAGSLRRHNHGRPTQNQDDGRGRPRSPCKDGMASTNARACCESLRFAPVSWTARGSPRPSQTRWRLLPSLARSVGLGPVCAPQKQPEQSCRPRLLSTHQFVHTERANPAGRSG